VANRHRHRDDDLTLHLEIFGIPIGAHCDDRKIRALLQNAYSAFVVPARASLLTYHIATRIDQHHHLRTPQGEDIEAVDDGELVFYFEKDVTLELERRRAEWFFLHAAALEIEGRGCLLIAPSGSGKSTTAWALLHHGFNYLSDELAPLHLHDLTIEPYPHALCLKGAPPAPYSLPDATLQTPRTLHVPTTALPCTVVTARCPLHCVFFLRYDREASYPVVRPMAAATAAAQIYTNGLNQLAHPGEGLPAAVQIAQSVPAFSLITADLTETCALIKDTVLRRATHTTVEKSYS
jgi:hypothetical protein